MSLPPLIEQGRRRDEFDGAGSAPVTFAEGQAWFVPMPWVELRAQFAGGVAVRSVPTIRYGTEADRFIEAAAECDDDAVRLSLAASLAASLLRLNYDLAEADLDRLLALRPDDPAAMGWPAEVMAAATGLRGSRGGGVR